MMYFDGPGREKRRDLMTLVPKSSSISLPSFPLSPSTYIFLFSEQRRRRLRSSKSPARLIRKYLLEERCTRRNSSCFSLKIGLGLSVARSIPPPFFASLLVRCQGFFCLDCPCCTLPPSCLSQQCTFIKSLSHASFSPSSDFFSRSTAFRLFPRSPPPPPPPPTSFSQTQTPPKGELRR